MLNSAVDINHELNRLLRFALSRGLIGPLDVPWAANALIGELGITDFSPEPSLRERPEENFEAILTPDPILERVLDWAVEAGLTPDTATDRDLLDTRLMGALTPRPSWTAARFEALRADSPEAATDWFYGLGVASNYIRKARVDRNICWKAATEYGELDVTINLSKPEKDPREIARARAAAPSSYPKCLLCRENEGFYGNASHPARQNLRLIPMDLRGRRWYFQYSPYGYYNEHCIVLSEGHVPMRISRETFENLAAFLDILPHYFAGSNADLPIVGGSILSHDHYQGGRYVFPMERAPVEREYRIPGCGTVSVGRVKWPMSALRLTSEDAEALIALSCHILEVWRGYTDASVGVLNESGGEPHNTITPIARRRGPLYEFDLVLRNNRTSPEHPLGIFHPHAEVHHIKKENIGLIEVMGLAVLPPRLKGALASMAEAWGRGEDDLSGQPDLAAHDPWYRSLRQRHRGLSSGAVEGMLRAEVGRVFEQVLHDSGVFKRDAKGAAAFDRFAAGL